MSQNRLDEKEMRELVFCLRPSTFRATVYLHSVIKGRDKSAPTKKPVALEMSVSCVQGTFRHRTKYTL